MVGMWIPDTHTKKLNLHKIQKMDTVTVWINGVRHEKTYELKFECSVSQCMECDFDFNIYENNDNYLFVKGNELMFYQNELLLLDYGVCLENIEYSQCPHFITDVPECIKKLFRKIKKEGMSDELAAEFTELSMEYFKHINNTLKLAPHIFDASKN